MDIRSRLNTTPTYISNLNSVGIQTIHDFLFQFPRTYEDRREVKAVFDLQQTNVKQTIKAKIIKKDYINTKKGRIGRVAFEDEAGLGGEILFFKPNWSFTNLKEEQRYLVTGKPQIGRTKISFTHPEMRETNAPTNPPTPLSGGEILNEELSQEEGVENAPASSLTREEVKEGFETFAVGRLYPVYTEIQGIKTSRFARKLWTALDEIDHLVPEIFDQWILDEYDLLPRATMVKQMHFPRDYDELEDAKYRYMFEKILKLQIVSLQARSAYQQGQHTGNGEPVRDIIKEIVEKLPFELTLAQKKCVKQIIEDMSKNQPMLRLLQGDVGSGKTAVATIAARYAIKQLGGQAAFLAPLEVLAHQHYATISRLMFPLGIRVEMLTGSVTASKKERIKQQLAAGQIDIIVGTHAIIQDDVIFNNLKFACIDEQHKFGVKQRAFLKGSGAPHLLQMTATPIPRSMALAYFGEFDVSVIDMMPAGRLPIITKIITHAEIKKFKPWFEEKMKQDQRMFVVVPLIEESEQLEDVKSAYQTFEEFQGIYTDWNVGLLHGKMKPAEKQDVMHKFKVGEYHILISTTVIEVGIDIPHATLMIIMNSERFGLSQLHQLRGRVGRNDLQSYCFLHTKNKSTSDRLKAMEETTDGFKLAEIDLKLRGPGELLGIRQSGEADLPLEALSDPLFIEKAQSCAHHILEKGEEYTNSLMSKLGEGHVYSVS